MSAAPTAVARRRSAVRLQLDPARAAGAALVLAYFVFFVWRSLWFRFSEDDMMNIYYYWSRGPLALAKGVVLFFSTYYRPAGGIFYSILYHFFGLDPLAYHVVIVALLLANTYLAWRFAVNISGSQLAAGFCALIVAYHAQMAWLVFLPAFIYDVLCFTFYFLAFNYYVSLRRRGEFPSRWRLAGFLVLYIAALEAKEMAVTLPVMIFLYELIWHPPAAWRRAAVVRWAKAEGLAALTAGLITAIYILGKTLGPDSLSSLSGYRTEFTWARYIESNARFLNTIFYQSLAFGFFHGAVKVLLTWAVLFYIAWRRREKLFWFLACFVIVAPLPVTFLPGRGGATLYIPLAGWALIGGVLFVSFVNVVAREPLFRRVPLQVARMTLILLGVALLWRETVHQNRKIMPSMEATGRVTWSLIEQLRALQPRVKPHSKVIFLDKVFDGWDVKFIAELTFRDRTVNVWLQDKVPLPDAEVQKKDYIFRVSNGKLVRLKP